MKKTIDEVVNTGIKIHGRWVAPLCIREQRRMFSDLQQLLGEEVVLFLVEPSKLAVQPDQGGLGLSESQVWGRIQMLLLQHYEKFAELALNYGGIPEAEWGEWSVAECYEALLTLMNANPTQGRQSTD